MGYQEAARVPVTDVLACRVCASILALEHDHVDLRCSQCGEIIAFRNGVYYTGETAAQDFSARDTIYEFGRRWRTVFREMGSLKKFFLSSIQPVQKDFFKHKKVIDGGGGFGRLSKLILEYGAEHVLLLDASDAVLAAKEYLADHADRVTLVKGDLLVPPFKRQGFDIFLCHGVLHHTGAPEEVLKKATQALNQKTGAVIFWVYSKEGNELMSTLIGFSRWVFARLGDWSRWRAAEAIDVFGWILTNLIYRPLDKSFGIKNKLYYGEYFMDFLYVKENSNRMDRLQMYHDFLTTKIVDYYSKDQIRNWLTALGFKKISIIHYRNQSWSVAASFDEHADFSGKDESS